MIYHLTSPEQACGLLKVLAVKIDEALRAGRLLRMEIKPESKTREQEEKYHAMIGDIAKQAQHLGAKWDSESWKRLLVDKFCAETNIPHGKVIPNLDGSGIVQLGFQTRDFTKEQASEFVEWLYAWSANNGINLI